MRQKTTRLLGSALTAGALGLLSGAAMAQDKEVVIGMQCDRTGPTQIVGTTLCPAYHDYVDLVNSRGGLEGYKVKAIEIDNEYKVPPAIESHQRFMKEGEVLESIYGTPQTAALIKTLTEDKIPGTSPGFGSANAADGKRFPYIFPIAATYWSQMTVAVNFVKSKLGGSLQGKKIAYMFFDNPAGKEPMPILEDLSKIEGFTYRTFGVPSPGVEMGAQVLDITTRYKPDFVIVHVFGKAPSVAMKELKGKGWPLSKVIGFVWASAESNILEAGGFAKNEGYYTIQYAGVGTDYPILTAIKEMYKKAGKTPLKTMDTDTVYYNRGVFQAAVHLEAIRLAIKKKGGAKPNGQDVRDGFEQINGVADIGAMAPPLKITAEDHEGGGYAQVWQVKGGKLVKDTDWINAYRDVIKKQLAEDAKK